MKKNKIFLTTFFCFLALLWSGCSTNVTKFYPDPENLGLSIFSNTNTNVMTCYVQNTPWRTPDRIIGYQHNYELSITKQITASTADTLRINWSGYSKVTKYNGNISVVLPIPKNFSYNDLSLFNQQRLSLDGTNGYFTYSSCNLGCNLRKGTGNIYFYKFKMDPVAVNTYNGSFQGLFDAQFDSFIVSHGRFDHSLIPEIVGYW